MVCLVWMDSPVNPEREETRPNRNLNCSKITPCNAHANHPRETMERPDRKEAQEKPDQAAPTVLTANPGIRDPEDRPAQLAHLENPVRLEPAENRVNCRPANQARPAQLVKTANLAQAAPPANLARAARTAVPAPKVHPETLARPEVPERPAAPEKPEAQEKMAPLVPATTARRPVWPQVIRGTKAVIQVHGSIDNTNVSLLSSRVVSAIELFFGVGYTRHCLSTIIFYKINDECLPVIDFFYTYV